MSVPFPPRFVPAPQPKREKLRAAVHIISGIMQPLDGTVMSRSTSWWTGYGTTSRPVLVPFGTEGTSGFRNIKLADFEGSGTHVTDVGTTNGSIIHPQGSIMSVGKTATSSWYATNMLNFITNGIFGGDLNIPGYGDSSSHPWDYVDIFEPGMYEIAMNLSNAMTCTVADNSVALDFFTASQLPIPARLLTFVFGFTNSGHWVNMLDGGDVALQSESQLLAPMGADSNRTTRSAMAEVDSVVRLALPPAVLAPIRAVRLLFGVAFGGLGSTPRFMKYDDNGPTPVNSIHFWPHSSIKVSAYDYDFELGINAEYPIADAPYFNSAM